jgi:hypothetical protein
LRAESQRGPVAYRRGVPRRIRYDAWSPADGRLARRDGTATWTSPWCEPGFVLTELVASWSVTTPRGSWVEVSVQAPDDGTWHCLGRWASGPASPHRTSIRGDPEVDTDTWRPTGGADAYRVRVGFHASPAGREPLLAQVGAVVSAGAVRSTTSLPSGRAEPVLDVPRLSQMTWRDAGGAGWCSPTAVSMVLAHAGRLPPGTDTATFDVTDAAAEVVDPAYDGTGNWPFNTAWAASLAGHGFVTRLHDLREAEAFLAAGIPLVASVAYPAGGLPLAPTPATDGHLVVIRGFTGTGDVVTNDPAAPTEHSVRRTYDRAAFERAWLDGSGGLVYVIHRDDQPLPARGSGGAW